MIDTNPITKKKWEFLNKIHDRLDEMDKKEITFLDTILEIKQKRKKHDIPINE